MVSERASQISLLIFVEADNYMAEHQSIGPIYRGEDVVLTFTMAPVTDITGWTIRLQVKVGGTGSFSPTLMFIPATIISAPTGVFSIYIPSAQSLLFLVGSHLFDIWRIDPGFMAALVVGEISVLGNLAID